MNSDFTRVAGCRKFDLRVTCVSGFALTALTMAIALFSIVSATAKMKPRAVAQKPETTVVGPKADILRVVVKYAEGTVVRSAAGRGAIGMRSLAGVDISASLASLQNRASIATVRPLFSMPAGELERQRPALQSATNQELADLANYYQIELTDPAECEKLCNELNALDYIEIAYPEPRAYLATLSDFETGEAPKTTQSSSLTTSVSATPSFQDDQDYLEPAPDGVDAYYAGEFADGDGSGMIIVDIENGWNITHEELVNNLPIIATAGNSSDNDHGTAVMGEILAADDGFGVRGIVPAAQWGHASLGSMLTAAQSMNPGDVFLIELHTPGPRFNFQVVSGQDGFVAMEYFQANFDVFVQVWAMGMIVCEAAGNGSENYDDTTIYQQVFDTTFRNSHAIMCGAGAPANQFASFGIARHRLSFSNYGERVNLQGYGGGVTTTGYGDLQGGASRNTWYTNSFNGTSSASPIVTGAVIALQSIYKAASGGATLDADEIRTIFYASGTPQQADTLQHIGPLPNLRSALDSLFGVIVDADLGAAPQFARAPAVVSFTATPLRPVDSYLWDFGDGAFASAEDTSHTYQTAGLFDLNVVVTRGAEALTIRKPERLLIVADTLISQDVTGGVGAQVAVEIYARNTRPLSQIVIPFAWDGPLSLNFDSVSTVGLRSETFGILSQISIDPINLRAAYTMTETSPGASLPPGAGSVLTVYFTITGGPNNTPHPIILPSFSGITPLFATDIVNFVPDTLSGAVTLNSTCCLVAGDANFDFSANIADVTFLVSRIFSAGPAPPCAQSADANADGNVNIADVTFLISWIFGGGAGPICGP
jgi:PKD domain/Subtilase family